MTDQQRAIATFQRPSKEFLRLNPQHGKQAVAKIIQQTNFRLVINGQVRGGKNGMGITKFGRHYARKPFKIWRDDAVSQLRSQLPAHWTPIATPCNVRLAYVAGDKRRRDEPAIKDAVWHVLEKSGVVLDDALLWTTESSRDYDKAAPQVTITFLHG